jgi:MFS family permease
VGAFQITIAAVMIPAGFLGDGYGRKRFLVGAVALYELAALTATRVTSATQLIWLMAAMGVAGAILVPLSFSTLAVLFPDEGERRTAVGLWASS